MEAARTASAPALSASTMCCGESQPPLAMTGEETALDTAARRGQS
jgi:hypothetical protein